MNSLTQVRRCARIREKAKGLVQEITIHHDDTGMIHINGNPSTDPLSAGRFLLQLYEELNEAMKRRRNGTK